jgi:hypothetical protein
MLINTVFLIGFILLAGVIIEGAWKNFNIDLSGTPIWFQLIMPFVAVGLYFWIIYLIFSGIGNFLYNFTYG